MKKHYIAVLIAVGFIAAPAHAYVVAQPSFTDNEPVQSMCVTLFVDTQLGSTGAEVIQLQNYLTKAGMLPPGNVSGYYGPATQRAVAIMQQNLDVMSAGDPNLGTMTPATRAALTCKRAGIPSSVKNATVSQSSVTSKGNAFTLKGTAVNTGSVFVALVPPAYVGGNWHDIYTSKSYVAFTGDSVIKVSKNRWSAKFMGVPSGTYTVLVFDNSSTQQNLLGSGTLNVSGSDTLKYTVGAQKPVILGVHQTATDTGLFITLRSVYYSHGTSGQPTAEFQIDATGHNSVVYYATVGETFPDGGGISDPATSCGGARIRINGISIPMNTATILVESECKG